jgi:UDP-N-acetylmuramoyl-L-alanyl-D-glutamate--2,6-diaminopimelate ligase
MKLLRDILYKVAIQEVHGTNELEVQDITFDSRTVISGCLYVALKGVQADGHSYIASAIEKGAIAIVCEELPTVMPENITFIKVKDTHEALGFVAANFYDNPSHELQLVGVTGTNGKTTTVTLLYHLFKKLGYKVGLISTVINRIDEVEVRATHTTPDVLTTNKLLTEMLAAGCEYCFMEVSSHAVVQHRVTGLDFAGGVFTNISHDHLDYHKTFDDYIAAKRGFFTQIGKSGFVLSNKDDKRAEVMLQESKAKKYYYGVKASVDFKCRIMESNFTGLLLKIDDQEVWCPILGKFNAYNLTAVYASAILLGQDQLEVLTALSSLKPVEGRFEYTRVNDISGIVDYAHTPDALENVLKTIKEIRTGNEQVITVVGCGGDRDKTKRPLMAAIATQASDRVILTSDNPRTEDPATIIEEMRAGVDPTAKRKVNAITDRKEAIRMACAMANPGDIILVAGKGHENYQEINGVRNHFDDMEILQETLNELNA